jgi:hypothetical protein
LLARNIYFKITASGWYIDQLQIYINCYDIFPMIHLYNCRVKIGVHKNATGSSCLWSVDKCYILFGWNHQLCQVRSFDASNYMGFQNVRSYENTQCKIKTRNSIRSQWRISKPVRSQIISRDNWQVMLNLVSCIHWTLSKTAYVLVVIAWNWSRCEIIMKKVHRCHYNRALYLGYSYRKVHLLNLY